MVGHTHEDVDQFFSRIRESILKHNVCTHDGNVYALFTNVWGPHSFMQGQILFLASLSGLWESVCPKTSNNFNSNISNNNASICMIYLDLIKTIRNAYNPEPFVEVLTIMFDICTWLAPARINFHNISSPRCFVLEENSKGDVVLRYKNWSRDKGWKPNRNPDDYITILQVLLC